MNGRCFPMSVVAQLLKNVFSKPWSPPERNKHHSHGRQGQVNDFTGRYNWAFKKRSSFYFFFFSGRASRLVGF